MSVETGSVKFAILGTARIATKVGEAIHNTEGAELELITSRTLENARAWKAEHGANVAAEGYEVALLHPEIQVVYIPLPPSMHKEWAVKAAEAGKHVLCEKPPALNSAEVKEMLAACRANGVQFMDGTMWSHTPRAQDMKTVLNSGQLGKLRRVVSAFSIQMPETPEQHRYISELGGGALYDIGWYCVRAALWAFDAVPTHVYASATYHRGVDKNAMAMMWFDDDRTASFDCGYDLTRRKWMEVVGESGNLVCDDFLSPWDLEKQRFWVHDDQGVATEHQSRSVVQEASMIESMVQILRSGELNRFWPQMALDNQRVVDALILSAKDGIKVEVN